MRILTQSIYYNPIYKLHNALQMQIRKLSYKSENQKAKLNFFL